jgi:tRNA(Ile)-lysidine synthase
MSRQQPAIVGLSGGADSVVLLNVLCALGFHCKAAHCNFHLRGEESDRDARFSREIAQNLGVEYIETDFDTKNVARDRKISVEMAARDLRYEWFESLRSNSPDSVIAVAHHRDDSIETFLLNLVRGTGIRGLTGIRPRNGHVVRPLLCVSKDEILHFAEENDLAFVSDSSNADEAFTRNAIRHRLLPLLETLNPSIRRSIETTMRNLAQTAEVYDNAISRGRFEAFDNRKNAINILAIKEFSSPEALLFEILNQYGFNAEVIADVSNALDSQPGKTFFSLRWRLTKDRDCFLLTENVEQENADLCFEIAENCHRIEQPITMDIGLQSACMSAIPRTADTVCLDADRLKFPLIIRRWQPGDRFIPFGMSGFVKLSDYFTRAKISMPDKDRTWLLTSAGDIVWIIGHRMDNRFRITEKSKKMLVLKVFS